jgi:uncharacterized protein (TIGR03083 family)
MVTAADMVRLDASAVQASVQVVSQARAEDLARPTPCDGWTLTELLAHMTAQHNGFAAATSETARISSAGKQGRQRPTRWGSTPPRPRGS